MKRFLIISCLACSSVVCAAEGASAQSAANGYTWSREFYIPPQYFYGPGYQSSAGIPVQPGSVEYSNRERKWMTRYQQNFPTAPYNYYGWSMPGSAYNNPYSLYGAGASTPTLLNPTYVAGGNYGVERVQRQTPNPYAPYTYEYVPYPRR